MLYTTYFSKINKLPEGVIKLIITRFPPTWLEITKDKNMYLVKEFSPYQETLLDYKKTNDWGTYVIKFKEQMNTDENMKKYLNKLLHSLQQGKDYALVCYEKGYTHCYRSLLAKWFEEQGIEYKEL